MDERPSVAPQMHWKVHSVVKSVCRKRVGILNEELKSQIRVPTLGKGFKIEFGFCGFKLGFED